MHEKRGQALIVANNEYQDPGLKALRAPAHDAEALARVLGDPDIGNFDVRIVLNEPEHVIREAVAELFAGRHPDDLLVLHFSCHGVKDEGGELFFAATNTRLRLLSATAVSADFVNRCMTRSRSRRVVLLLDCCYAGAFERGMAARAGSAVGIEERFGGRGRAVITASSALEYAFEGSELAETHDIKPSVFTSALVEGLQTGDADRDQDGYVSLDELYDHVYEKVRDATPNQTPGKWTFAVQGDLYIARRRNPVSTPVPLSVDLQQAIDSPLVSIRIGAVKELERLLEGRHAGLILSAKLALASLANDDSRTVSASATAALSATDQSTFEGRADVEPGQPAGRPSLSPIASARMTEGEPSVASIGPTTADQREGQPALSVNEPPPVPNNNIEASVADRVGATDTHSGTLIGRGGLLDTQPRRAPPLSKTHNRPSRTVAVMGIMLTVIVIILGVYTAFLAASSR